MPKHILIVDDEKDIVALLVYNLEKEGYTTKTAHTGTAALKEAQNLPDLVLLDVMMPEVDGLEVARRLKKETATAGIPIIFLTAKGTEIDEVVGLELGAEDYIVKPISIPKLLARIRAVLRRHENVDTPSLLPLRFGDVEVHPAGYRAIIAGREVGFTKKEFDILVRLATKAGTVLSRDALLDAVWGDDVHVIDRTIDVHIRKIREKLGSSADLLETVKGVGYRIRERR